MADICDPQGMCLLQQQLMAQSILGFGNLVTTSHNQDIEYLKTTQIVTMAAIGKADAGNTQVIAPSGV